MTGKREGKNVLLVAGSNSAGQLGLGHLDDSHIWQTCPFNGSQNENQSFPPTGSKVIQLSSGAAHTVAILEDNEKKRQIWVCGSGVDGQLGPTYWKSGDEKKEDKKFLLTFTRLNVEDLLVNSQQLSGTEWSPKFVECGWDWTLIVLEDSKSKQDDLLLVLGVNNDFLQLGYMRSKGATTCSHNVSLRIFCDSKEQNVTPRIQIEAIACGLRHSIVLCSTRSETSSIPNQHWLIGWGASRHGQIGKLEVATEGRGKVALACLPRIIQGWQSERDEKGDQWQLARLAAGKEHSVILVPAEWQIDSTIASCGFDQTNQYGNLFSFGSNRNEQCAFNALPSIEKVQWDGGTDILGATWNGTILIKHDNLKILSCGNNAKGQLGTGGNAKPTHETELGCIHTISIDNADHARSGQHSVQLACGSEHVAVLLETNNPSQSRVLGWGWNEHGNLAQNDEADRRTPVQIWPPDSETLIDRPDLIHAKPVNVWAGCGTTFLQIQL